MGAITYKANKINTYVKPEIAKSASNIYEAMLTANEIKCPSDFSYCQYVNNLYNNLGNLKKHVQGINSWLLESNSKIKKFENTKKTQIKNIKKSQIEHKKISNNKMKIQSFSVKKADKDVSNREINDGFKSIYDLNVKNANMVGAAVIAETNDTNNFEKISLNPTENVKKTGAKQAENTDSALDWGIEQAESIGAKIVDVAESFWGWLKGAASKVLDFIERCAATVLTAIQSILKGLLEFVEAILDFAVILGSGIASVGTGIADGVSYLVTGETLGATKGMWKWTKSYVSYEVVDELSDILYKDTAYGKWLSEKSFISPDGTVANVLSGVGYVAGVVVLSILTFGTGGAAVSATSTGASAATGVSSTGMAAVAGAAGVGKGTQDAWNDGASVVKGLGYGAINGAIEGVQFYAGAKINGLTVTGGKTVAQKFVNSGVRIALDGADSAVEVPIYAGLKGIYNDKSFQQNWDNDGGWKAVGTAAAVGSIASSIGEADLSKKALSSINKTFKSTKGVIKNISPSSLTKLASGKFSIVKTAIGVPTGVVSSFSRFGTSKLDKPMMDKISKEGLYHITSAKNVKKIFDSNYIKRSKGFFKNYGFKRKAFFFGGAPTFESGFINLSKVLPKVTAIKVYPSADELITKKFRYRKYNDKAVTFAGNYDLTGKNAKQAYLVLKEEGNKLKYKEVSKTEYDNYKPNFKNEYNKKVISRPWRAYINTFQYHFDFFNSGIKEVKNLKYNYAKFKGDMKSRMYKIMKYIDPESEFSMRGGYVDLSLNEKNVDDALEQARIDLNLKMEKYATYSDIKESDVYIQYMKNHEYKNDIFDNLESDMKQLEKGIKKDSKKIDNLLVKKSKQSIGSLKSEILDSMPNNLSKVEKARYIYINLSKKVKYDENYFVTQNEDIYKQVLDINNLKGNKVICKGWSELYKQLLLQAGFSEDEVKIVGRQKIGAHKLVEIKLNGYKVFADATNNYGGMIDLISTKVGAKTMGFVRAPLDLDLSDKGGSKLREFFTKRSSLDEKWVEEIDKTIYPDKKNIDDLSKKINENFGDSSIYSKLFGSNYNENIDSKIRVLNPLLEKLDGFETFGFLKKQKSNFFNSSENSNTHVTLLQKAKNGKEGKTLTCLSVKISDNKYKYYINKDGAGLIEVPVKTIHDLFQVGYDYWGDHQEFILGLWK